MGAVGMDRRDFVKGVTAAGITLALGGAVSGEEREAVTGQLQKRAYGDTGVELSIIGLGGIVVSRLEQARANDIVAWAVDRGVNYFDVAPTYGDAEERLGPALKPYPDSSFLACKTIKRDAAGARDELEHSLRVLQTDYFDLYQLHGLSSPDEVEQVFGVGGAMETFIQAREQGLIRFIGFSAHSVDAALLALERFSFDSVLMPFNVGCIENGNFGPQVIEKAQEMGTALLALKAIAWSPVPKGEQKPYAKCWYMPIQDRELARLALGYTLDLPVTAAVPPGDETLFQMVTELALEYKPLEAAERQELLGRIQGVEPIFRYEA